MEKRERDPGRPLLSLRGDVLFPTCRWKKNKQNCSVCVYILLTDAVSAAIYGAPLRQSRRSGGAELVRMAGKQRTVRILRDKSYQRDGRGNARMPENDPHTSVHSVRRQRRLWGVSRPRDVALICFIGAAKTNLWGIRRASCLQDDYCCVSYQRSYDMKSWRDPQRQTTSPLDCPGYFGAISTQRWEKKKKKEHQITRNAAERDSGRGMTEAAAAAAAAAGRPRAPVICWWIKRFISWLA